MGIDLGCVSSGEGCNRCEYSRLVGLSDYLIGSRHCCDRRWYVSIDGSYCGSVARN
jgi:hypothetical protein